MANNEIDENQNKRKSINVENCMWIVYFFSDFVFLQLVFIFREKNELRRDQN